MVTVSLIPSCLARTPEAQTKKSLLTVASSSRKRWRQDALFSPSRLRDLFL
jgi:hypothetical protein